MHEALRRRVAELFPGARIRALEPLAPDSGKTGTTEKAVGYGEPMRIALTDAAGHDRELVWHGVSANAFGHDRRADRFAEVIGAYDDFAEIPRHVQAIDVGAVAHDGALVSLCEAGEPYLITSYARGTVYAGELRRIAAVREVTARELARLDTLALYLAGLHTPIADGAVRYRRAIRDLVGSGEGIYGMVDGYPPGLASARLRAIEEQCAGWRWRLRERETRLTRTHGDFHPFNIVFDDDTPAFLDASRGACGDPADDLTALAINFLLFAADDPPAWRSLGVMWRHWWATYLGHRDDPDLLAVAPPFLAWRTLVVCNPHFYPKLGERGRDLLLGFCEDVLAAGFLDPMAAEEMFA
ncbi:MAG: phosphotransferase [Deltaproteobacteria bacterium]